MSLRIMERSASEAAFRLEVLELIGFAPHLWTVCELPEVANRDLFGEAPPEGGAQEVHPSEWTTL